MIRGELPSRLDLFRFVVALSGIYLVVALVGELSWTGLVLAIVAPFFYAVSMTIIHVRLRQYDSQTVVLYMLTFVAILLSVAYLAAGYRWPDFDAVAWGAVLWVAMVAVMGRLLLFAGIKIVGSRQAALLTPLDILLTVLLAVWLLGESITRQQWVGTLFVVASVVFGAKAKADTVRPKAT